MKIQSLVIWIAFGLVVIIMLTCNINPVVQNQATDFKYTIESVKDRVDDRLYVLGFITNGTDKDITVTPTVGVYQDKEATRLIKKYTGVLSKENVLTPNSIYLFSADQPRNPSILLSGESISHLTITDPIFILVPDKNDIFWYFWWESPSITIAPKLIAAQQDTVITIIDHLR